MSRAEFRGKLPVYRAVFQAKPAVMPWIRYRGWRLYEETPESVEARERVRDLRRFAATPGADLQGRPTKRDRRALDRLRRG